MGIRAQLGKLRCRILRDEVVNDLRIPQELVGIPQSCSERPAADMPEILHGYTVSQQAVLHRCAESGGQLLAYEQSRSRVVVFPSLVAAVAGAMQVPRNFQGGSDTDRNCPLVR